VIVPGPCIEIVLTGAPLAYPTPPAELGEAADTILGTQTLHEPS